MSIRPDHKFLSNRNEKQFHFVREMTIMMSFNDVGKLVREDTIVVNLREMVFNFRTTNSYYAPAGNVIKLRGHF